MAQFQEKTLVVNRFFVKKFEVDDLKVCEYRCQFQKTPEPGYEQQVIAKICYKLGTVATRLGSKIIAKVPVSAEKLTGDGWQLEKLDSRVLDCDNLSERKALESLERRALEQKLRLFDRTAVERSNDGGLIWWITAEAGREQFGAGWEVHKGRRIDISLDSKRNLYLEIDIHHRFYTPWTLHQWLDQYPEIPISYVRNNYRDSNGQYITWRYQEVSKQSPQEVLIEGLNVSLADYHLQRGASEEEIDTSYVVYVKRLNQWNGQLTAHLSQRLSPSLTMEMLAYLAEIQNLQERKKLQDVFSYIRKNLNERLKEATKTANFFISKIYQISSTAQALTMSGYVLPPAKLLARNNRVVAKVADVLHYGCTRIGENQFGCLNLFNQLHRYPSKVEECLKQIATKSGAEIAINSFRTQADLPQSDLERDLFWQRWADEGIKTVLVVMPWSSNERKQSIRVQALRAGIATQFIVPQPPADRYKAINVVLGLLCKAGWQPVRLQPLEHPEAAELIIGFDAGTNRELYYGSSAFAVLADGQSLGWELPDVQRGETFSGQAIWQTVSKLILQFRKICHRYPRKILIMRDGLVQEGEFQQTIQALKKENIAIDIISVRKSGAGRMGYELQSGDKTIYQDAKMGSVVPMPDEKSFILVTSQAASKNIGSARPLRVVHEYGNTRLGILALQTYHLSQLHPASGFSSCRLPWVLHLADKSSKEFQRIRQISILQNLDREKLIAI